MRSYRSAVTFRLTTLKLQNRVGAAPGTRTNSRCDAALAAAAVIELRVSPLCSLACSLTERRPASIDCSLLSLRCCRFPPTPAFPCPLPLPPPPLPPPL